MRTARVLLRLLGVAALCMVGLWLVALIWGIGAGYGVIYRFALENGQMVTLFVGTVATVAALVMVSIGIQKIAVWIGRLLRNSSC
ncbi:MAG: hypothetical protein WA324_29110 [Bryobacteraceae bacterium]